MRTFNRLELLSALQSDVNRIESVVKDEISGLTPNILLQSPAPDKWSIAQCLEHLNGYGRYYLPQLDAAIAGGALQKTIPPAVFKSSWLGNYFTNMMKPQADGALKSKMQSPRDKVPQSKLNTSAVLDEFMDQQKQLTALLQRAEKVNIQKLPVPTSLSKWIKLSAGDTFRFLIAHEQRHLLQALRAKSAITGAKGVTPAILLAI
ncbi:DinB family protein [uncultured Chitinophaga sp.]|uniref:DinB family protein n=1 Tax=uncultured Chitinophaga sp. TaxID=339340 RepID=UPI0025E56097|nr:DinB family protein [uncultured Chitinophaga sp.]